MSVYRLKIKLNQFAVWGDLLFRMFLPFDSKIIVVTGFPKSGTTWACQLLSDAGGLYFNNKPYFPRLTNVVVHCHRSTTFLLKFFGKKKSIVYVVRDPRDVLISAYHSIMSSAKRVDSIDDLPNAIARLYREMLEIEDEKKRLHYFCTLAVKQYPGSPLNWSDHIQDAINNEAILVKYEDLKDKPRVVLERLFQELNIDAVCNIEAVISKYEFKKMKLENKSRGEAGYYRNGDKGGYINEMSLETIEFVNEVFSSQMQEIGYC